MHSKRPASIVVLAAAAVCFFLPRPAVQAQQKASSLEKDMGHEMVSRIKADLKKNYYDPAFHGMDIDARLKAADEKINAAASVGHIFGIIAQALVELEDSHTFFLPPGRVALVEYGWEMQMVGDQCLVTAVKPGSDAAAKGLKEGDELWAINGIGPSRANLWKIEYYFKSLRPQPAMELVVKRDGGKEEKLVVMGKITERKRVLDMEEGDVFDVIREDENYAYLTRHRYVESGDDVFIWKMPQFDLKQSEVDLMMEKVRKRKSLILDLRGNGGGLIITLERLAGYFFDHDVKIADRKGRKEMKPQMAKTRGDKAFTGRLIVLIDSRSGSAAEIFARLVQLEHRGTVLGDRSAGAVMESGRFTHQSGVEAIAYWGVSVTVADVIMGDGQSLEKTGVSPDETILLTSADLAAKRDPILARAAELVGVKLDAAKAGAMFPIEWIK